jgi:hypothetical protein
MCSSILFAQKDQVPTTCHNMPNNDMLLSCQLAMKFNNPLIDTSIIVMTAGWELTAKGCGYKLSNYFFKIKKNILRYEKNIQIYNYMINNSDPSKADKNLCDHYYKLYTTDTPEHLRIFIK